jgi:hypothetical protein
MIIANVPMRRSIVLLLGNTSHRQKDIVVPIRKIQTILKFYAALYLMEQKQMLFVKQYLIEDAATA